MGSVFLPTDKYEKLDVLIVGAGIAGLTAAAALRQAGHKVTIFESSRLLHEVGAAITLSPNGTRVLAKLGFDFEAAKGVRMESINVCSGTTLENSNLYPPGSQDNFEEILRFPYRAFHRVDLHNELRKLALGPPKEGEDEVEVLLGVKITSVDVENAKVVLSDGRIWRGDLLVGADGIHSVVRETALRRGGATEGEETEDVGWDIYRFLQDTKDIQKDDEIKGLMKKNGRSTYVLPYEGTTLRLVWYSCRNGEVQNFAAFCPAKKGEQSREDYDATADKGLLLEIFSEYHPAILRIIRQAPVIKSWRLRNRHPLPTFVYGKTVLIGDAAHPMLPFAAQGGNQALEDAGAILSLFSDITSKDDLPQRLKMFDLARRKRACRLQVTSSVPAEEVKSISEKLKEFIEEADIPPENETLRERLTRDFGYNIFERCEEIRTVSPL